MTLVKKSVFPKLKEYGQIKTLMATAFPRHEQFPFWFLRLMAFRKSISFEAYYDQADFVGISYTVSNSQAVFVLYLAVSENHQSKGYGGMILQSIKQSHPGKEIMLNIEPVKGGAPNIEQRQKRLSFYQRHGFQETGYVVKDKVEDYSILSTNSSFQPEILKTLLGRVSFGLVVPEIRRKEFYHEEV